MQLLITKNNIYVSSYRVNVHASRTYLVSSQVLLDPFVFKQGHGVRPFLGILIEAFHEKVLEGW
jgi:hypothetical protein